MGKSVVGEEEWRGREGGKYRRGEREGEREGEWDGSGRE